MRALNAQNRAPTYLRASTVAEYVSFAVYGGPVPKPATP